MNVKQKRLQIKTIAKALRTHPDAGTAPGDIERINMKLTDSFPQIQLKDQLGGSLPEIIEETENNEHPIIAWLVVARDEGDIIYHAVLINGVSEDRTRVFYVDPEMNLHDCQCDEETGTFIDDMLTVNGHLVKLIVTEKGQKDLLGKMHPLNVRRRTQ